MLQYTNIQHIQQIFNNYSTTIQQIFNKRTHTNIEYAAFSHHYQGSNIYYTVWMYFLVLTENRDDIEYRDHIVQCTPCSLGSVLGNIALGTVFLDTLPRANIRLIYFKSKPLLMLAPSVVTPQNQYFLLMLRECTYSRTLPQVGMHWKIHPPQPSRFPSVGDFAPLSPWAMSWASGCNPISRSQYTPCEIDQIRYDMPQTIPLY